MFLTIKVVNFIPRICLLRGLGSWLGVSCKVVNEIGQGVVRQPCIDKHSWKQASLLGCAAAFGSVAHTRRIGSGLQQDMALPTHIVPMRVLWIAHIPG